jgi:high affinity Mn2+ porin
MRYLQTIVLCCLCVSASLAQTNYRLPPAVPPIPEDCQAPPVPKRASESGTTSQIFGELEPLPAVTPVLPSFLPSYAAFLNVDPGDKDKNDKNGTNKNGKSNGDDKDKKEEMQKILQLLQDGKLTVAETLEKLTEKPDEKEEKDEKKWKLLPEGWNFHAQTTLIPELDAGFPARYSGPNSLSPNAQIQGTVTADLYLGVPLWHGAEFHADLLMWQGFGLNDGFGIENNPNGDAYKAGTENPRFMMAHFFIRQTVGLGGEQEDVPDGSLTLPGKQDVSRLTITAGRMSVGDIFDRNTYNHDPHSQFMSWSSTNLAWDYPSDTVGFTTGIVLELNQPDWAVRYGWYQMPSTPNGYTSDDRIFMWPIETGDYTSDGEFFKQWGMMLELERRWKIGDHPGAIRLQSWLEHGYWASYNQATALLLANPPNPNGPQGVELNIPAAAFGFHYKYGFGLNWEQEIAKNVGIFGKFGWQDGQTAPATYTDVDWTVQLGLSVKGAAWCRPGDTYGLMGNLAGASSQQIAFLHAGGQGISDGDGNLTYGPEMSLETYYDWAVAKNMHFALDYQFFANPSFNRDRGPVSVFLLRYHWEF